MAYALPSLVKLKEHGEIISRIAYKSRAQHRSSRAFKAVEGVRRSFKRLQDLEREAKELLKTLKGLGRQENRTDAMNKPVSSSSTASFLRSTRLLAAYAVLRLILTLLEIQARSISAVAQLSAHLRTPPAPTFAPLIFTQLASCSVTASEASLALYGGETETTALLGLYNGIRGTVDSSVGAKALHLPSPHTRRVARSRYQAQTINRVSASSKTQGDLSWLPSKLIRPAVRIRPQVEKEHNVGIAQGAEIKIDASVPRVKTGLGITQAVPVIGDDEDLGEAI